MNEEERDALDEKVNLHKETMMQEKENNLGEEGEIGQDSQKMECPIQANGQEMPPQMNQGMQNQQTPPNGFGMPQMNQGMQNQQTPPNGHGMPLQMPQMNQGMQNQQIPPSNYGMPYQQTPQMNQGMQNQQVPPLGYGMQNQQMQPQMYEQSQRGYGERRETETKGMAIASMVLGIVGLVLCAWFYIGLPCAIVGLVLGCVYRSKGGRNGMATAGIICSSVALGIGILGICIFIINIGFWWWY